MTMAELFEAMPARLNSAAAAKVHKTIQWNITGDDPEYGPFKSTMALLVWSPEALKNPMLLLRSPVQIGLLLQRANSMP